MKAGHAPFTENAEETAGIERRNVEKLEGCKVGRFWGEEQEEGSGLEGTGRIGEKWRAKATPLQMQEIGWCDRTIGNGSRGRSGCLVVY